MFPVLVLLSLSAPAPAIKAHDALEWVNRTRAARGLPPFRRDKKLSRAAMRAAEFRAKRGIEGHTSNDFGFIPHGGRAAAAGCAAWPLDGPFGKQWGSCATYDSYRYAGAAWAIGRDRKRYVHTFYAR